MTHNVTSSHNHSYKLYSHFVTSERSQEKLSEKEYAAEVLVHKIKPVTFTDLEKTHFRYTHLPTHLKYDLWLMKNVNFIEY